MPVAKGENKPQYSESERAGIVEKICLMYESQQATLASCCESAGVSDRVFQLWKVKYAEIAERYEKAKQRQDEDFWQDIIRPLSKRSLQKHLEIEEIVETKVEDVVHEGSLTGETKTTKTTKPVLPNPTMSIVALKGVYPEKFVENRKITGSGPNGEVVIVEIPDNGRG